MFTLYFIIAAIFYFWFLSLMKPLRLHHLFLAAVVAVFFPFLLLAAIIDYLVKKL